MMVKKKRWIVVVVIVVLGALLFGGIGMVIKKTVKEETHQLDKIQSLHIVANMAEISISLTDGDALKIIQYSQKKVDATFQYDAAIENGILTIMDKSQKVPYSFGVEGSPGISYEIQLPMSYSGSVKIILNQGNIIMNSGQGVFNLADINIENTGVGNINIGTLAVTGNSQISTGRGNINLTLNENSDYKVNTKANSGNVTVADVFSNGMCEITVTSEQGNITVEASSK